LQTLAVQEAAYRSAAIRALAKVERAVL
jgi:hypothetical protein